MGISSGNGAVIKISKDQNYRDLEGNLWIIIAVMTFGWLLINNSTRNTPLKEVFSAFMVQGLTALTVLAIPLIYKLIFGVLPFEGIRNKITSKNLTKSFSTNSSSAINLPSESSEKIESTEVNNMSSAEAMFWDQAAASKIISTEIYNRSKSHLFIGSLIASMGVGFFYSQTSTIIVNSDLTNTLLTLSPKFGILLFIELIAFFFLKQYRISMEDFKYFESIKRKREEVLALIRLATEQGKPLDASKLLKLDSFSSSATSKFSESESGDPLSKEERIILEKLIDTIAKKLGN